MARIDLEELRPQRFVVRNAALKSLLRGEGEVEGDRFTLTSWRRDGLFARLRARTFVVYSLDDLIAGLPLPPSPPPDAAPLPYAVRAGDRFSQFDLDAPGGSGWVARDPDAEGTLLLRPGAVLRRRKGRGVPSYVLVTKPGAALALEAIAEERALLHGYAGARGHELIATPSGDGRIIAGLPLPPSYVAALRRIGEPVATGWLLDDDAWPFALRLCARLGLALRDGSAKLNRD